MIRNKNFIWNTIGTGLNSFLSLFLLIIVTRINGIELSGKFSFVFSLTLVMQSISNYGGRIYQISDIENEFSFEEYLGSRAKTSIISIIVMVILSLVLRLDFDEIRLSITLMAFRIIETFSDVFYASFQKNDHLDYVGISLTIKTLLVFVLFLMINVLTKKIIISSVGIFIASVIVLIAYDFIQIKKYEKIKFKFNNDIYKKSKYIFLFGFITYLLLNVPRVIANFTLNDSEIGYLGILMMIPTIMALICQFIIQPQLVVLTKSYYEKDTANFNSVLRKSINILVLFSILCSCLALCLGPMVLNILYGISFESYRITFLVLILAGTFNGLTTIFSNVLTIMRKTKIQFIAYVVSLIISVLICFVFAIPYKLAGLCFGLMLAMLIQCIIFYIIYRKYKI